LTEDQNYMTEVALFLFIGISSIFIPTL